VNRLHRVTAGSNVEIVRDAFEAYERRDFEGVLALCDPDIVVHDPGRTGAVFRGHDALMRFWQEWLESWDEYTVVPTEVTEADDEIFVACRQTGRAKLTGIEISQDLFQVFRFRSGRIVEYRLYAERGPALDSMNG
jgi:ketosteroid isomerase-like protein